MTADFPDSPAKQKKGRAPFTPTPEQRADVARLAAARELHDAIAAHVGVSVPTLRKYFDAELSTRLEPDNLFTATGQPEPAAAPAPPRPPRAPRADGRKPWVPSRDQRDEARLLIAANFAHKVIAARLGVSEPTFRRTFREDLHTASEIQRAELLVDMRRAARKGNVTAQTRLYELLDKARLQRLEDDLVEGDKIAEPARLQPLGKKEAAQRSAQELAESPQWQSLLSPADDAEPPAPSLVN